MFVYICLYTCLYVRLHVCLFVCLSYIYVSVHLYVGGTYLCKWTNEGGGEEAAAPGCTTRVGKNCIKLVHAITQYYDKVMTMVVINKVPEHVMNLLATYRTSNRFDGHGLRPPEGDRPSHYRN